MFTPQCPRQEAKHLRFDPELANGAFDLLYERKGRRMDDRAASALNGLMGLAVSGRRGTNRQANVMRFTRITVDARQMGGVPCLRGLRIPVATVVAMIADGMTEAEVLAAYPDLQREDIAEALRYAAEAVRERELPLVGT